MDRGVPVRAWEESHHLPHRAGISMADILKEGERNQSHLLHREGRVISMKIDQLRFALYDNERACSEASRSNNRLTEKIEELTQAISNLDIAIEGLAEIIEKIIHKPKDADKLREEITNKLKTIKTKLGQK